MRWIKTGRQIGQAVKNVQRLRQVISVFAKHGFADILHRMNLGRFLPRRFEFLAEFKAEKAVSVRLREAFEELGPTFIKFGQLLSTRPDLLPEHYIEEMVKLQDNVLPLPYETIKAVVEKELHHKIGDYFESIQTVPLASASIAQVHEAKLRTGESVVVKVQRPEIAKLIDTDISLLVFLAALAEKYIPELRVIGPKTIVDEFFRTLSYELNFYVEANNMIKIGENLASMPEIVIPKIYKNLSTGKVLTQEKLDGIPMNNVKALEAAGVDKKKIVEMGARAFFKTVMIDGLFHGDLHGGNLFVLKGNKLGTIDFGIVGRISQRSRDQLANMVMSLITEDYENLCYQYAELGIATASIDFESFQREVRNNLSPYLGLSLSEVNIGKVLIEATKIAVRYNIKVPGDWMIVFKAILTMEGMGRSLDPHFNMLALGQELVKDLVKNQYSMERFSKEFMWAAKDLSLLAQTLPRQIRWMFKKFNSNDFAVEIKSPELERIRYQMDRNASKMSQSLLAASLFLACALTIRKDPVSNVHEYPLESIVFFLLGFALMVRALLKRNR
jgi:ubiquinone biosynthesis protein